MNFVIRAIKSLKERKGKTLIILAIMLTVCLVILTSFSIQSATEVASVVARQKLGAEVSLVPDMDKIMENGREPGQNDRLGPPEPHPITLDYLNELKDLDHVTDYYIKSNATANLNNLTAIGAEESTGDVPMRSNGDVTISGVNNLSMEDKVKSGSIVLEEGRELTEADLNKNVVLIESTFAKENNLNLGDKISLSSTNGEQNVEVEIVGIFKDNSEIEGNAYKFTSMLPYNNMYVPYTVANTLKGSEYNNSVDSITFLLDDPINVDTFIKNAENTNIDFNTLKLDSGDKAYETMMGPIENVASFSKTTLIMVTIFGGVILSLIVMLSIKDRIHEIGILMSLGERKLKIIGQLLTEITIVLVIALGISGLFGNTISSKVGDSLIQKEISIQSQENETQGFGKGMGGKGFMNMNSNIEDVDPIEDLDIQVSANDFVKMSSCALVVSIIATIIPSSFIMRLNPKNILSKHS